ncbi:MAG: hypothetical protein J4F28_02480 [Nitrosopumilaceae archaeon]|nr:hypothetical protein [Nitrosopumilaceae archaeon]
MMARDKRKKAKSPDRNGGKGDRRGGGAKPSGTSDSSFKAFLKKRAPIYLGLLALFLVFVIPELTKGSLEDALPELEADGARVVDVLMSYRGPDGSGFSMREAISDRITEEFGDRIYGHKETAITVVVSAAAGGAAASEKEAYDVEFVIDTHKGQLHYTWTVDADSGTVTSVDPPSKHVVDVVNFYD